MIDLLRMIPLLWKEFIIPIVDKLGEVLKHASMTENNQ